MNIFSLINRENRINSKEFVSLGLISGISNAAVLAIVNVASESVYNEEATHFYMVLFLLAFSIYLISQRTLLLRATNHVEQAVSRMRTRLTEDIRHSELPIIEFIGKEKIYAIVTKELQTISLSSSLFVVVGQSSILAIFTSLYIAWLSPLAFLAIISIIGTGAGVYLLQSKKVQRLLAQAFTEENRVIECLSDLLHGFKEVRLNNLRSDQLELNIERLSDKLTASRYRIQESYTSSFVVSQVCFYGAIGSTVFIVPSFANTYADIIMKVTAATLFLIGPISSIVGGIPSYSSANAAAQSIFELEENLKSSGSVIERGKPLYDFSEITLENVFYKYHPVDGRDPFEVGPFNCVIRRGQVVFITGGNGSGKTTFMKVLTGLYQPSSGHIRLDGNIVSRNTLDSYRNIFCSVFSDYHLFKTLYGASDLDDGVINEWLRFMEMDHKVHIQNDEYDSVRFSSGQKKRLALASSVFEGRRICVMDEWAADQDPIFRRKFYHEVIPKLKERGMTIIAITHDNAYFDHADIQLTIENGKFRTYNEARPGDV